LSKNARIGLLHFKEKCYKLLLEIESISLETAVLELMIARKLHKINKNKLKLLLK